MTAKKIEDLYFQIQNHTHLLININAESAEFLGMLSEVEPEASRFCKYSSTIKVLQAAFWRSRALS